METILPSLITGAVALIVCVINNAVIGRRTQAQNDITVALIQQEISTLSDRVEKHNSVITRTYELEKQTALMAKDIKAIESELKNMRKGEA